MGDSVPPEHKPKTKLCLLVVGLTILWMAILGVIKSSVERVSVPPWGNPQGEALTAEVAGTTRVGQQFVASLPGLHRVDVALVPATDPHAHLITFHLKSDPTDPEDLWTTSLSSSDVQDGVLYPFEFEPLRD